ncbi:MAG: DUF6352 family protein [Pseudomonadota bacterium]|nr:DUF6352 family protein [Pseudomonadota bacterium]
MAIDYWPSCGYRLLRVTEERQLAVTPEFLRSMLLCPELAPVEGSAPAEIALHEQLMHLPEAPVAGRDLDALIDADVAHNYRVWLRFRDRLLRAPTLEAAYLRLFRDGVDVPPSFVDQLTSILVRHILPDPPDAFAARAGEMLFRRQKIAISEGVVVAADAATVETQAVSEGFAHVADLLRGQTGATRTIELDVLAQDNAAEYWLRDERFDMALRLERGSAGLTALTRVLERWIAHFLNIEVSITPRAEIDDTRWVWHVGLDAQASELLNDLYNGVEIDEARMRRLLCLFELRFANPSDMRAAIAGRPVYLAIAIDAQEHLRIKPQNLLLNLPLRSQQ